VLREVHVVALVLLFASQAQTLEASVAKEGFPQFVLSTVSNGVEVLGLANLGGSLGSLVVYQCEEGTKHLVHLINKVNYKQEEIDRGTQILKNGFAPMLV